MIDGRYSLVYPDGQYRTIQIQIVKKGPLLNKIILSIKVGHDFKGVAFLFDGKARFWNKFKAGNPAIRLERIQKAVDRVMADPEAAGMAYAMKENRCYKCGRELTVPASIHKGMGPECAKKNWTKQDQVAAYEWRAEQSQANLFEQRAIDVE